MNTNHQKLRGKFVHCKKNKALRQHRLRKLPKESRRHHQSMVRAILTSPQSPRPEKVRDGTSLVGAAMTAGMFAAPESRVLPKGDVVTRALHVAGVEMQIDSRASIKMFDGEKLTEQEYLDRKAQLLGSCQPTRDQLVGGHITQVEKNNKEE